MPMIAGNVNECPNWTAWKNWDQVTTFGTGDKETPQPKELPASCNRIGTQGRITESKETVTSQQVKITLEGLVCLNENQIDDDCWDYEIRFCCEG